MSHQITLRPSGHMYTVRPGETVLEAALREGFPLPYGCRNGACASCKGLVLEGRVDFGAYQAAALSEEERRGGYALFCCAKPETDLVIECREINAVRDIPVRTMPCRVQSMTRAAPEVMIIRLRLPTNERLQFLAGQYIDILLKDGKRRSFSLANPPHDDALLELHVRHVPGGFFSGALFNEYKGR